MTNHNRILVAALALMLALDNVADWGRTDETLYLIGALAWMPLVIIEVVLAFRDRKRQPSPTNITITHNGSQLDPAKVVAAMRDYERRADQ